MLGSGPRPPAPRCLVPLWDKGIGGHGAVIPMIGLWPGPRGNPGPMPVHRHPAGYHCSKALTRLGLSAEAIATALRRQLALDTGEIEEVLACPITPPEGTAVTSTAPLDLTERLDVRTSAPEHH